MSGVPRTGGVVLVAKPGGITSHDVVEGIRRAPLARGAKVGHAGTLDPFATGLLLLLVGRATRVQRFFMALPKTYRAVARFGAASNTGDPTGRLTPVPERVDEPTLRAALPRFTGELEQRVPLTSAVKVAGERLYRKAHRGEQADTPVREVRIDRLELLAWDEQAQRAELELDCSSGTYVRMLVADIGEATGGAAYCEALERLAVGPFRLEDADPDRLISLEVALDFLPTRTLGGEDARRVGHGRAIEDGAPDGDGMPVRLVHDGRIIAIAEWRDGVLKPVTVLRSS